MVRSKTRIVYVDEQIFSDGALFESVINISNSIGDYCRKYRTSLKSITTSTEIGRLEPMFEFRDNFGRYSKEGLIASLI